jgi:hypothetical protein
MTNLGSEVLSPAEADEMIKKIANLVHTILLDPPPGIRACLVESMVRARAKDRKVISTVADFLTGLVADQALTSREVP